MLLIFFDYNFKYDCLTTINWWSHFKLQASYGGDSCAVTLWRRPSPRQLPVATQLEIRHKEGSLVVGDSRGIERRRLEYYSMAGARFGLYVLWHGLFRHHPANGHIDDNWTDAFVWPSSVTNLELCAPGIGDSTDDNIGITTLASMLNGLMIYLIAIKDISRTAKRQHWYLRWSL